ncbi:MAG: hypothetical protein JST19_23500 [Bacteroidetes bacterium]|nr:hypothetical protein [Bacteroidota bacterium]
MKPLFLICLLFIAGSSYAQDLVSAYKPRNKTEKLIIAKVKALPEIKEWYITAKSSKPDLIINLPNSSERYYSFQVGISNFNMFRTNYYLFVNPKTFTIYYNDDMDESGGKLIPLEKWRYWRSKSGFFKMHKWINGKLVALKDKKYAPTKSS